MKKTLLIFAFALRSFAQQNFDFSSLDKLAAVAKNKTIVTLNGDLLKLAAGLLGSSDDKDAASIRNLVNNLKGIYVRTYEFDKEGQYTEADLAPLRGRLKSPPWNKVMESVEGREASEVWLLPISNDRLGGVAIISAEPKSLTVVFVDGTLNMSDIATLSGNMGIPDIKLDGEKKGKKAKEEE